MEDLVEGVYTRYSGEARLQRLRWIIAKAQQGGGGGGHTNRTNHSATGTSGTSSAAPSASVSSPANLLCTQAIKAFYQASLHDKNLFRYRELFGSLLVGGGVLSSANHPDSGAATTGATGGATTTQPASSSLTLPEGISYEASWVEDTEAGQRQDQAVLRHRLQSVQSHLHKEAIRAAYLSLAQHYAQVGDLYEAFNAVLRAKDYCTSRHHTTTVCLQIVNLALLLGNPGNAKDYLMRLQHTIGTDTSPVLQQEIQIASGLERLLRQDYSKAAHHFMNVCKMGLEPTSTTVVSSSSLAATATTNATNTGTTGGSPVAVSSPNGGGTAGTATTTTEVGPTVQILAAEEISLYAAILAMACCTEADMVALAEHPEALELVPQLKEALILFGRRCDYRGAWKLLQDSVFGVLEYDLFMAPHLVPLQTMIREKAIASLWKAYERIELSVMAQELGPGIVASSSSSEESVSSLRNLLVKLIRDGKMPQSRIDLSTHTIHRDTPPSRQEELRSKLECVTQSTLNDTYSTLTRLSCLEQDLVVVAHGGGSGRHGDGTTGGLRGRRGGRPRGGGGHRGRSPNDSTFVEDTMMEDNDDDDGEDAGAGDSDDNDDDDVDMVDDENPEDRY
jgi:hypothetical protein